ncbi:MAG: DUF86 domain-containing protein [Alphaproteobacteria bacterium]|nr:DUF86 domain-containing protein [Alphaproteobacteria bacterium]
MSDRTLGDLTEIADAIDRILTYTAGLDERAFVASGKDVDAAAMNLLVIGEAVRRIDPNVLAREPGIAWPAIVALRNRIAHGYASLQPAVIWSILEKELPSLRRAVARLAAGLQT